MSWPRAVTTNHDAAAALSVRAPVRSRTRPASGAARRARGGAREPAGTRSTDPVLSVMRSHVHSWRRAVIGSTRVARRAGRYEATRATAVATAATAAKVSGSLVLTP